MFVGISGLASHYRQIHQQGKGWSKEDVYRVARRVPVNQQAAHAIRAGQPGSLLIELNTGSRDTRVPQEPSADRVGNVSDSAAAFLVPLRSSRPPTPSIGTGAQPISAPAASAARPQASSASMSAGLSRTHGLVDDEDEDEDEDDTPLRSRKRRKTVVDDAGWGQHQANDPENDAFHPTSQAQNTTAASLVHDALPDGANEELGHNPKQGERINPTMYPSVVHYSGKWYAISCRECGANASQRHRGRPNAEKPQFFRGISGLTQHYAQKHKHLEHAPDIATDVLE